MRETLGQPVVIENVTGAAGSIATGTRGCCWRADGHTIMLGNLGTHVVNGAIHPAAIRPRQGLRADLAVAEQSSAADRQQGHAGKGSARADRAAQGKPRQGDDRQCGAREPIAPHRSLFPQTAVGKNFQLVPYCGTPAGAAGPDRGAYRSRVRPGLELVAAGAQRPAQRPTASPPRRGLPQRPKFRPSTRAGCRDSMPRSGSACGRRRTRPRP